MKYLAIDTSLEFIEILLYDDGERIFWREENGKRASEVLLCQIDEMLSNRGLTVKDMDYYGVVVGPGSFTGIRIGVNTVKAFSFVTGKPIVAITSLQKLAYNDSGDAESIVCVVNAYADLSYISAYSANRALLLEPKCVKNDEIKSLIALVDEPAVIFADEKSKALFGGAQTDGSKSFSKVIEQAIEKGELSTIEQVEPFYIAKSQAERELEAKNANS